MTPQTETLHQRVHRVDARIATWRDARAAFVVCLASGTARAFTAGGLRAALNFMAGTPGAQILEVADRGFRQNLLAWAIAPRKQPN